jgi:hypothetical protein
LSSAFSCATLRDRIGKLEQQAQQHKSAMEAALNEERQYLDRVRELRAKLYDAQGATEDRLRDIQRRGMSEAQQQADLLAQAKEKQAKAAQLAARAEQAAIEGRSKDAERLAQLAQREAEGSQSLAERLKDNRQAYSLVAAGGQLVERAIRAEIDANVVAAQMAAQRAAVEQAAQQQTLALVSSASRFCSAASACARFFCNCANRRRSLPSCWNSCAAPLT